MFQAFIDDSGSRKGDPVFVLAGFVATAEQWAQFSDEWRQVLAGPPRLEYFKMSEADSRVKQFSGWTEEQIKQRVAALADVVRTHVILRLHCAMFYSDYERVGKGKVFPQIDDPYFFCFYALIHAVSLYSIQKQAPVNFVFDQQGQLGTYTRMWWSIFKLVAQENARWLVSEPSAADDRKVLPLQAADLYAFHIRRHLKWNQQLIVPPSGPLRILANLPSIDRQITEKDTTRARKQLKEMGLDKSADSVVEQLLRRSTDE